LKIRPDHSADERALANLLQQRLKFSIIHRASIYTVLMPLFTCVDDRTPAKLLLCARDVLTGILTPWHVSHRDELDAIRVKIDIIMTSHPADDIVISMLETCVKLANDMAMSALGAPNIHGKLDRARLTLQCLATMCDVKTSAGQTKA
jgi:hypothetical protein